MGEIYNLCPICRRSIVAGQPGAMLVERVENMPGFGQEYDPVWTREGYAHTSCLLGARGYRVVADPT